MRNSKSAFCAILAFLASSSAFSEVDVQFANPDNYQDAGNTPRETERILKLMREHLQALAKRYLPPQHQLNIEILDVDLAGRYEMWKPSRIDDVRIVRASAWPRIKVRYRLQRDGQTATPKDEVIADLNFLQHANRYPESDPIRYEKQMLEDWFRDRFSTAEPGNR